uniref:OTU domain-containing protein n=1 Tax=Ditylenchus dipsaci TaxID=166011 RepID=A0A915DA67_9BILA
MESSDGEDSDTSVDFLHESVDQLKSFKFSPVDHTWRKDCCSKLGLEFNSDQADKQYEVFQQYATQTNLECGMEELPEVVGEVFGDGNCLFRALCHIFTAGSEDQHPKLRELICSFMQYYQESFAEYEGKQWPPLPNISNGCRKTLNGAQMLSC